MAKTLKKWRMLASSSIVYLVFPSTKTGMRVNDEYVVYVSLSTLMAIRGEKLPEWMVQTAYILTRPYCRAACAYCWLPLGKPRLARVPWYPVKIGELIEKVGLFRRVCIQTVIAPGELELVEVLVSRLRGRVDGVSVALGVVSRGALLRLRKAGVDEIGIGVDAASERVAVRVSKPYDWRSYIRTVTEAVNIYGEGRVNAHLIIGLGETAREAASFMRLIYSLGARVALFPYTPAGRLGGKPPTLCYYRGAQLYRQLLEDGLEPEEYIEPGEGNVWELRREPPLDTVARAIMTSGCTWCNRPFYTESPRGPLYNTPWKPSISEARRALRELWLCGVSSSSSRETASYQSV